MSLNGLDHTDIKEAHHAALSEPGGWFLLKYTSRDEVDILGRGNGGIVEIRNKIAQYEEPSPLFGFLLYRRRKVLIRYVPEECSRLVQARVHVHFNAVMEHFSPHDALFPISSSKELKDSTLSAACSLHTASGSTSSSTSSLRRRRLMEIEEENEEEVRAAKKRQSMIHEELERPNTGTEGSIALSTSALSAEPPGTPAPQEIANKSPPPPSSSFTFVSRSNLDTSPPPPRTSTSETRSQSPTRSIDQRKNSSQSVRSELYTINSWGSNGKHKVKLGPRPSIDSVGRPNTSGSTTESRPISSLPPGLKLFSRNNSKTSDRPQSLLPTTPESDDSGRFAMPLKSPPIPESSAESDALYVRPNTGQGRPSTSSGVSVKSARSVLTTAGGNKRDTMTPEKARLMKALQMRKKQMATPPPQESLPPLPSKDTPEVPNTNSPPSPSQQVHDTLALLKNMADEHPDDSHLDVIDNESDATRTMSPPGSPVDASERAESTQASSISESTDETIQEARDEIKFDITDLVEHRDDDPDVHEHEPSCEAAAKEEKLPEDHSTTEFAPISVMVQSPTLPEIAADVPHSITHSNDSEPLSESKSLEVNPSIPVAEHSDAREVLADERPAAVEPEKIEENAVTISGTSGESSVCETHMSSTDPTANTSPRTMMIPTSKFSVKDDKTGQGMDSHMPSPTFDRASALPSTMAASPASPVGSTFSNDSTDNSQPTINYKRRGQIQPIGTDTSVTDKSGCNIEDDLGDDEEFMKELSSVTVQEARPMHVGKSPATPVMSKASSLKDVAPIVHENRFSRNVSQPVGKADHGVCLRPGSAGGESVRSVSAGAAYLQRINEQKNQPVLAKKVNIGSSISQRIKALEQNLTPESATQAMPPQNVSPAFFAVRKVSVKDGKALSVSERAHTISRPTPSPSESREPSPSPGAYTRPERSGSLVGRLNKFEQGNEEPTRQRSQAESISVTARIVRDPSHSFRAPTPDAKNQLDLKQSPLIIDHQKAVAREVMDERRLSNSTNASTIKNENRISVTTTKDALESRRNSFNARRSLNMETSSSSGPQSGSHSRPPSTHQTQGSMYVRPASNQSSLRSISSRDTTSHNLPAEEDSSSPVSDKKESRASRMMRRMSSGLSVTKKSLTHSRSPTVREEDDVQQRPTASSSSSRPSTTSMLSQSSTNTIAEVGDVNVQFPDTLLWKRRSVRLDSAGFLILEPSQGTGSVSMSSAARVGIKKIHLSAFQLPFVPDAEVMEMPNSVVLRYTDGGSIGGDLQIACEDRCGQMKVLDVLQEAHANWAQCGQ